MLPLGEKQCLWFPCDHKNTNTRIQVHSLNENEVRNPPSLLFNYYMHITSLGMLHGLLYFRTSNLASPLFISQRWIAHKIYGQNIWCHCVFESLRVQVRNKNSKSALRLLIATQNTDYNRFHSFLISFLWTNFHISPGSNMPAEPAECVCQRRLGFSLKDN